MDGFDDAGFVVGVSDSEPARGGGENFAGGLAFGNEVVNDGGDIALGSGDGELFLKEGGEVFFGLAEVGGGEAPEVHGDDVVFADCTFAASEAIADDVSGVAALDVDDFFDVGEVACGVGGADATIDAAVVGEGVFEVVADDGVVGGVVGEGGEEVGGGLVGVGAVEVVGVDDGEGFVDDVASGADGVGGAPGFFAVGGEGEAVGEVVEFLEGVVDCDFFGEAGADSFFEGFGEVLADDEDDFTEPGANGVEDGVVEDGFAVGAHGVHLFEASVAGAHSGGEDEECGFGHVGSVLV